MIYSVQGKVTHTEPNLAVIECGGVGFACRTTVTSLSALKHGADAKLLTHMNVREDAIELFGFADDRELYCFKLLLSVSGVGPKAALAILSAMSPQEFALAVVADDAKALARAPGVGAKTAALIILKLKDKLAKESGAAATHGFAPTGAVAGAGGGGSSGEAIAALLVLGFSASEAAGALAGIPQEYSTSDKIKGALKKLASK